MLFQFGALFTDLSVFENVAFPLREHTDLDETMIRDIVLMKLNAVGLRGAAALDISEISGGMARRVALARAIALDPELIMYDEPFAGLDPISMAIAANLIRTLNDTTGATAILVSHDVAQCFKICDYAYLMSSRGKVVAEGTPKQLAESEDPEVRQFIRGEPDGPVRFHYPARPLAEDFGVALRRARRVALTGLIDGLGRRTLELLRILGHHATFFVELLRACPAALRRPYLVVAQIHAIGNLSLVIILASGLAVGFVLALQMYYALVTYGASESLGLIVNLSLTRELGPVVTALLFAGRAGHVADRRDRPDEGGRAARRDGHDGRRSEKPRAGAALSRRHRLDADPGVLFSSVGILGAYVVAVLLIGVDAGNFWSIMQSGVDVRRDIGNGIVKSIVFGFICTFVALYQGYEAKATPEGVAHGTTRTVVIASLGVLMMDFVLTALMFSTP